MGADGAWRLSQRGEVCGSVCWGRGGGAKSARENSRMKTDANSSAEAVGEQPPTDGSRCFQLIRCQAASCGAGATAKEEEVRKSGALTSGMHDL